MWHAHFRKKIHSIRARGPREVEIGGSTLGMRTTTPDSLTPFSSSTNWVPLPCPAFGLSIS